MRRSAITLLLVSVLTFCAGLGRQAIGDADEAFYAEAAREMVESGDWLTPHFNYQYRWQKPILYYWLTAATYLLAGPTEWAARSWSAIAGLGLVLLTWSASRRLMPNERAAWLAGAITATSFGYFALARAALPDLPLAFCVTLTVWAAFAASDAPRVPDPTRYSSLGWSAVAGLGAGLGFLLKGPVAVLLPALVVLPIWLRERLKPRGRDILISLVVFGVVGGPWYAAMTFAHGIVYLQSFFVGDNLERFATDRFNDPRPFWFYLPIVIGGMVPWAVYLLVLPWRAAYDLVRRQRHLARAEWRLVIWAAMPLLFFTLSIGKQPRYILPVLPPLAILLAHSVVDRVGRASRPRDARDLKWATWATAAMYAIVALLFYRARGAFITAYPWATSLGILAVVASGAALAWVAVARVWNRLPAVMTIAGALLLLAAQFGALSGRRPEPVEEMASLVLAHRTSGERVGEYGVFVRNFIFYTRFQQAELSNEDAVVDFIKSPDRILLVVGAADLDRLETVSGVRLQRLGQVEYLNTANLKLGTLFGDNPNDDFQQVLLVANR